jgi:hypothetical protein
MLSLAFSPLLLSKNEPLVRQKRNKKNRREKNRKGRCKRVKESKREGMKVCDEKKRERER